MAILTVPWLIKVYRGQENLSTVQRLAGLGLLIVNTFLGGVAALLAGATMHIEHGIMHGLFWPFLIKTGHALLMEFGVPGESSGE